MSYKIDKYENIDYISDNYALRNTTFDSKLHNTHSVIVFIRHYFQYLIILLNNYNGRHVYDRV